VNYLIGLRRLIKAGFPIMRNDLPFETWEDLGVLEQIMELKMNVRFF